MAYYISQKGLVLHPLLKKNNLSGGEVIIYCFLDLLKVVGKKCEP